MYSPSVTWTSKTLWPQSYWGKKALAVSFCEPKLHLHSEPLHPLQMSGGLAAARASSSITVSSTGQTLVDNCQKESRDAGGSEPCSHSCCTKSAERGHKMACVQCLNISHLQSNLMNYSDSAICCASHLKHLSCQPLCQVWLTLCPATGSF